LEFAPPGPGFWEQDPVHFPRAMTRYWTEVHPAAFARGTADFASFYGMLIGGLAMGYVNGIGYKAVLPPPEEEIPRRFQRAEEVFAAKLWRAQLREWDELYKPAAIARHRELQAVDAKALSDDELVEYLGRCRDHHAAMITQHMRNTASAVVPTGDFLAHVGDWTGLPPAELLGLMRGASPVSAGASSELERLIAAVGADPNAQELLASDGDPGATLNALASREGETGAAMTAYLELVGNRLLDGFDISEPSALELPDQLLRAMRTAVAAGVEDTDVEAKIADVRSRVAAEHQDSFDELSAKRGSCTACGTSAASTATSGRPGSCAAQCWRPAGESRRQEGSRNPSTCWTPDSTRCARSSKEPTVRPPMSSPHVRSTAGRTPRRTRRGRWGRRHRRRPIR